MKPSPTWTLEVFGSGAGACRYACLRMRREPQSTQGCVWFEMKRLQEKIDTVAEDGHPCEAALEFRRDIVRHDVASEVSADALDMAISFAWLGKAVSRTTALTKWSACGVDPNTSDFIRALALSDQLRRTAAVDAVECGALTGRDVELGELRKSHGFMAAMRAVQGLLSMRPQSVDVMRLSELHSLASGLPGKKISKISTDAWANVLPFPNEYKKRRR